MTDISYDPREYRGPTLGLQAGDETAPHAFARATFEKPGDGDGRTAVQANCTYYEASIEVARRRSNQATRRPWTTALPRDNGGA